MNRPRRWGHRRVGSERGSGTVLAAALGMVLILATSLVLLLAQSAVLASQTAAAADLAALAAADALRGVSDGDPCAVAASVATRHSARLISCIEEGDLSVEVHTQSNTRTVLGAATGRARAGPPP
jgi:secretion/DNA translocation related TadE-like protein